MNSDQSGFQLELHWQRTLEILGTKTVQGFGQSVSATTHSYTICPVFSLDGTLFEPMLIVFQEPKAYFPFLGKYFPICQKHISLFYDIFDQKAFFHFWPKLYNAESVYFEGGFATPFSMPQHFLILGHKSNSYNSQLFVHCSGKENQKMANIYFCESLLFL